MKALIQNLKANGFEVLQAKDGKEALSIAKTFIKDNLKIGLGGSESVKEIGLLDYLVGLKNITLFNQYEAGISMEENLNRRKNGLLSDLYITSSNAITLNGWLVNVDGTGNRVAAQIFGPKKVLLVVGKNKIVLNLEKAIERIEKIAAVKNADRINKTAIKYGKIRTYTPEELCNKYSIIKRDESTRTTIILVDEELGY